MMIVSLFAIVPISAGAATTYNSGGVHAEDLVAGDVITDNIDGFDPYGYSFVLKAGTFGAGFNTNMISDVLSDDLEISENDFSCSIPNGLLILDLSTFTSYYPLDENGDYSGKFYVWDVTGTTITLGGYAAPEPADPIANEPTGLTATTGQTLADVTLTNPAGNTPGTWSWDSPSTSVGNVGSHTFPATFTPNDTSSYKTVQKNLTVTVTAPAPAEPTIYDSGIANVSDLAEGDAVTNGIDAVEGDGLTYVFKGGRWLTNGNIINSDSREFTGSLYTSTNTFKANLGGLVVLSIDENGDVANAFVVLAKDGNTITLGGCSTPAGLYKYEVENGNVTITRYIGLDAEVTIPSEIDGYTVTAIDRYAFYNCYGLTSVAIPNTVTAIGNGAFSYTDLTSVTFVRPSAEQSLTISWDVFENVSGTLSYSGDGSYALYDGDTEVTGLSALNDDDGKTFTWKAPAPELFHKHSVTLGGDIGVNFYLNPEVLNTYNGAKTVTFTWDGNTQTVDVPATATADGYKVTCNVVAAQMAHKIHIEVYAGDEMIDDEYYSVQDYAEKVYGNPEAYDTKGKPDELKALAKAMLNYGAMAQTVFATSLTETPELPTGVVGAWSSDDYAAVTADTIGAKINGSAFTVSEVEEALGAKFYTSSLIYLSQNTLRLYFTPVEYGQTMPNAGAYTGNLSDYYYFVDHANIPAAELDNQQTFNIAGTEFTFSALDYAKAVVNSNNMLDTQKDLAKSLYLYNQAANAYFDPAPAQNIVDLSTLTAAYEAQDVDVLTGTLSGNKKITVAAGATVTLRNVTITGLSGYFAGITPLGNATILLEGENTVKGGYEDYPGIFVPENATLTIGGTGSLDASSNGYGCGIGGGYGIAAGNIVINGGTITATGGEWAAGIGSGYEAGCGDITINGGTITATGGEGSAGIGSSGYGSCGAITITGGTVNATGAMYGAGIGSGCRASCGNITIAATVTQVTATAGEGAASIGAGYSGTCGTISIADPSKVTQN